MSHPNSLMPSKVDLGRHSPLPLGHIIHNLGNSDYPNPAGLRTVMGFVLPEWQRPLCWTTDQDVAFLRSAWLGLPLGTYSYNQSFDAPEYDGLLLDGQQRLHAIERYLNDEFEVFGYHWSDLPKVDHRRFKNMSNFAAYVTESANELELREYYDRMNFGGVAHTEDQRAIPLDEPPAPTGM